MRKLLVALAFVVLVVVFLLWFLRTRLGLSIRATGDNTAMIKSSSVNPSVMITIGLCISSAITALGGCLIGEYNKSSDINMGSGMVTIALASLIIGETLFGKRTIPWRVLGVVVGSCLYRVIVAVALRFDLPASALKLVSAVIVAVAISYPTLMKLLDLYRKKLAQRNIDLYLLLLVLFGGLLAACVIAAAVSPAVRSMCILLGALAAVCTGWAAVHFVKNRKGAAAC